MARSRTWEISDELWAIVSPPFQPLMNLGINRKWIVVKQVAVENGSILIVLFCCHCLRVENRNDLECDTT